MQDVREVEPNYSIDPIYRPATADRFHTQPGIIRTFRCSCRGGQRMKGLLENAQRNLAIVGVTAGWVTHIFTATDTTFRILGAVIFPIGIINGWVQLWVRVLRVVF